MFRSLVLNRDLVPDEDREPETFICKKAGVYSNKFECPYPGCVGTAIIK